MANDESRPEGELLVYQGQGMDEPLRVRLEGETVWLSQKQLAELYGVGVPTINEHITHIYEDDELPPEATIRKYQIVQTEGTRQVKRLIDHYSLEMIIAVGFRVRSRRGSQFRHWANERISERAQRRQTIQMQDWEGFLDKFLADVELPVLNHAGSLSHNAAVDFANTQYNQFADKRRLLAQQEAERRYIEDLNTAAETLKRQREKDKKK